MPASLIKMPSPLATAVVPLAVPPSIRLISAVVVVTPSRILSSVAVEVTATSSLILGAVSVLLVNVCVAAIPAIVSVVAGNVSVTLPLKAP